MLWPFSRTSIIKRWGPIWPDMTSQPLRRSSVCTHFRLSRFDKGQVGFYSLTGKQTFCYFRIALKPNICTEANAGFTPTDVVVGLPKIVSDYADYADHADYERIKQKKHVKPRRIVKGIRYKKPPRTPATKSATKRSHHVSYVYSSQQHSNLFNMSKDKCLLPHKWSTYYKFE